VAEQNKLALFEQWALPHKDYIYTACFYLTRVREDAEDLAQETYLRAFRFFHQFTPGTNCRAWLLTIMHNTFRTGLARQRLEVVWSDFDQIEGDIKQHPLQWRSSSSDHSSPQVLAHLFETEVSHALLDLPEEARLILLLVDLEEMTYEETANILGCPVGTVRSRLSRARQALRDRLTAYAREQGYLGRQPPDEKSS